MLKEAFPRLAVRLRSTFPDAKIELKDKELRVDFPTFPNWGVKLTTHALSDQFQMIESRVELKYDCLKEIPAADFFRLISAENLGLRGASIICVGDLADRVLCIRSSFMGQKGRTRDEAENIAIDVLSILRFARLFEDRVTRSKVGETFVYDVYYSQYLARSIGRTRFINYARSIFHGSTERVFGQLSNMLKEDYHFKVNASRNFTATVIPPASDLSIILRIPEEIPMITCSAALYLASWEPEKSFSLVAELNQLVRDGHFEVNADGSLISFVTWKQLTNDLRYYSLDHMVAAIHEANLLLTERLPNWEPVSGETRKQLASSLDAYARNAA